MSSREDWSISTTPAAGKGHHAALRALANRWLEILWHCLQKGILYDEAIHTAKRNQALRPLQKAA